MEIWKRIPGYSLYEVSSYGRLKTFNWKNQGKEKIMLPAKDNSGYLRTMLKRDGDGKFNTIKVHRIVAMTFIPNLEDKPQVNHKNSIRTDNRVCNLEWCTHSENIKHSFDKGMSSNVGEKNPSARISEKDVISIRRDYANNKKVKGRLTKQQLADKYNTTFVTVKNIVRNKTWKHLL